MDAATVATAPPPGIDHTINPLKVGWRRFGTPILVVLMALAIALTITRNWNAWEGGRAEQVTNDAYVRRDIKPLSTKVAGLVREVKVGDYQHVHKGDELVRLEDADFQAQVAQAAAAVDAAKAALENNRRQRALQDARILRALAGIDQANAQIVAAQAGRDAVEADLSRTRYNNGLASYIEILTADQDLFEQQRLLVQTGGSELRARAELYRALGGGWQP